MQRLLDAIDRAKCEACPTSTKNQWRDHNVEAVETSCLDETRKSIRASFHEHAPEPELGQRDKNVRRQQVPICCWERYGFNSTHSESGCSGAHHYRSALFAAQACALREPPPRVHHDTYRIGAADAAYSQLRIVSTRSLDPNNDGINQGSQAMKMFERSRAIDIVRAAGSGCHSAVEGLADLASDHKIVDLPHTQRSKKLFPPRWQRLNKRPE
jgi:hypothetical protein